MRTRSTAFILLFSFSFCFPLLALDENEDGVSDVYAAHHGLTPDSAHEDPDGDGQSNRVESAWGTDPHDPLSKGEVSIARGVGSIEIFLSALTGKTYQFSGSPNLSDWNDMGEIFVGTGEMEHLFVATPLLGTNSYFLRAKATGEADEDEDGLGRFEEHLLGTSDDEADSDDDELTDRAEFTSGLDPLGGFIDSDSDGFSDDFEVANAMDPTSPDGSAPTVYFSNAVDFMHFTAGESYDFRVHATEADPEGLETVKVSLGGKSVEAIATEQGSEFVATFDSLEASDSVVELKARAYGADGSRGDANGVSIDVAPTERWITLVKLGLSTLTFDRRMEGEYESTSSSRYFRGESPLRVSNSIRTPITEVDLEQYGDSIMVVHDQVSGESLILENSPEDFPLHSWIIYNLYGQNVHGSLSYNGNQSSFSIPDGETRSIPAVNPYPSSSGTWDENLEMYTTFEYETKILSQVKLNSNGGKTVAFILPPDREGSIRPRLHLASIPETPLILATPYRQGTIQSPGARRHFLENQNSFNLPLLVNADADDGLESPDFADALIGENDNDLITINVRVDLQGLTDCEEIEIIPSSEKIRLYRQSEDGVPVLASMIDGRFVADLTTTDWSANQLIGETGLDFFIEAISSSLEETLSIRIKENELDEFPIASESVKIGPLLKVDLAVDANQDSDIKFDGSDRTTGDEPYYFWLNNDSDSGNTDIAEDLNPSSNPEDHTQEFLISRRNLEDLSRLWINLEGLPDSFMDQVASGEIEVGFKWRVSSGGGSPEINVYRSAEHDGGNDYLFDDEGAIAQLQPQVRKKLLSVGGSDAVYLPSSFWTEYPAFPYNHSVKEQYLLFEATSEGKGELVLSFKKDNQVLFEGASVWMDLRDIKRMYQHFTVAVRDNESTGEEVRMDPVGPADEINDVSKSDLDEMDFEEDYILFVHGWRMHPWERRAFAETAFKRLYWQGYTGRFGMYSWPTEWAPRVWWFGGNPDPTDPQNYTRSERKARLSGEGLKGLLNTLEGQYTSSRVHMFSHSMGAVVASEALRLQVESSGPGHLVSTFVACQSASTAHSYDGLNPEVVETDGSTQTPEVYRNYPVGNQPYYGSIGSVAETIVNFHNREDDALSGWLIGQDLKPDYGWYFEENESRWYRDDSTISNPVDTALFFPTDRYEIFAHIAEARSKALGSAVYGQFTVSGPIDVSFDLNAAFNYSDTAEDHSAQFRSTNMRRAGFYRSLLDYMGL